MKLALLTGCAAALTLFGAAAAQAEIVSSSDPGYVATDPGYVAADTNVIATTPGSVVAVPAPPFGPFTPRYIVTQPTVVVAPRESTIITTGSSTRSCFIDLNGFERCY
jgi:hypothetical protein